MADLWVPAQLAVKDPLGGTPEPMMTGHDGIAIHTMAGTFAGTDSMFHDNGWGGTESTFGVAGSGYCKQWTPWNRQADANLDGNPRWVSIENADGGETFPPLSTASDTSPPFTDAQIDRMVSLCVYLCDVRNHAACPSSWRCHTEGIPPVYTESSCGRGIAGHRAGIDNWRPNGCPHWSSSAGKICPRTVRLNQVRDIIVPRVAAALGNGGFLMGLTDAQQTEVYNSVKHTDTWMNVLERAIDMEGQATSWKGNFPGRVDIIYDEFWKKQWPALVTQVSDLTKAVADLTAMVAELPGPGVPGEPGPGPGPVSGTFTGTVELAPVADS